MILVTGMHNSGTSILARVLHENGIYMCPENSKYENWLFTLYNNSMMRDNWIDKPEMIDLTLLVHTWKRYYNHDGPCGVKDPRICLMAEEYKASFGGPLVYIEREVERTALGMSRKVKLPYGKRDKEFWYPVIARYHKAKEHADYTIQYEEMCKYPHKEFEKLFDFLGMEITNRDVINDVH